MGIITHGIHAFPEPPNHKYSQYGTILHVSRGSVLGETTFIKAAPSGEQTFAETWCSARYPSSALLPFFFSGPFIKADQQERVSLLLRGYWGTYQLKGSGSMGEVPRKPWECEEGLRNFRDY